MKTLTRKPDTIIDEIRKIRDEIYEETKDMTSAERIRYFSENARRIEIRYRDKPFKHSDISKQREDEL